jgi:hypothetical protein
MILLNDVIRFSGDRYHFKLFTANFSCAALKDGIIPLHLPKSFQNLRD